MNPNTYTQPNQKSYAMAHGGDVGVVIQLNQKCAVAQAGSVGMGRKLNQKYAIARAGDVGVVFQPKREASQVTRACRIGMDFGSTE